MVNAIKKGRKVKQAFNELKTQHGKCSEKNNSNKPTIQLKPLFEDKKKKKKEEEKQLNEIRKYASKNNLNKFKLNLNKQTAPLKPLLKDKNKQQKKEKEKLKQIRKNIKPYIPVDSKRFLDTRSPYVGGNRIQFKDTKYKDYSLTPDNKHNLIGGKKPGFYNLNNKQPVKSK